MNQFHPQFQQQYQPPVMYQPYYPQPQQTRQQVLVGRTVSSADEITPNEVPMDGTAAYFPTVDGGLIVAKAWNSDGQLTTVNYAPVMPQQSEQTDDNSPTLADVMNQLSNIQDQLDLLKPKQPAKRTAAKKGTDDESDS